MASVPPGSASSFADLGMPAHLVAVLTKLGIDTPTPIQHLAIPVLMTGESASLRAETGTGKTLAFLLPILAALEPGRAETQAVIVAPTHELAIQIHRQCTDLAQHGRLPVRALLLIGGTPIARQLDKLKSKPHIAVGSPGRIREHMDAGKLKTQAVRTFVVDEADRLLAGEELGVVRAIVRRLRAERQLVFVSATEAPECARAMAELAPGIRSLHAGVQAVSEHIRHLYTVCEERDKPDVLRSLLHATTPTRALVFAHQNETAERVAGKLRYHRFGVVELHAGLDKQSRKQSMDDFRAGTAQVLVASDVAARGLDIAGVTHVFNLDAPSTSMAYLHRVGRCGRAGARGEAVTLMTERDTRLVGRFERELGITMEQVRTREGRLMPAGPRTRSEGAADE